MPVLDRQSFGSANSTKPCHPERSLAMSEANRQTESKDPVLAGITTADPRNSKRVALRGAVIAALAILTIPAQSQTSRNFPGPKSELASPDGRYVIQNVDPSQHDANRNSANCTTSLHNEEYDHFLFLKDKVTGKSRQIYQYGRGVSVVWSPDSGHLAINDYAGSDYTETSIFSVEAAVPKIDVQKELYAKGDVTLAGDHEYFGVAYWIDNRRVVVHHWGYGNGGPGYCECYVYTLKGAAHRCARQPNRSDDEFCERTTP